MNANLKHLLEANMTHYFALKLNNKPGGGGCWCDYTMELKCKRKPGMGVRGKILFSFGQLTELPDVDILLKLPMHDFGHEIKA